MLKEEDLNLERVKIWTALKRVAVKLKCVCFPHLETSGFCISKPDCELGWSVLQLF